MLTIEEAFVVGLSLLGVAFNSLIFVRYFHTNEEGEQYRFGLIVIAYALLVVLPHTAVILYAFTHMQLD